MGKLRLRRKKECNVSSVQLSCTSSLPFPGPTSKPYYSLHYSDRISCWIQTKKRFMCKSFLTIFWPFLSPGFWFIPLLAGILLQLIFFPERYMRICFYFPNPSMHKNVSFCCFHTLKAVWLGIKLLGHNFYSFNIPFWENLLLWRRNHGLSEIKWFF